jgi:hypothetical protein
MLRIATRGSKLALAQAGQVAEMLGGAELVEVGADGGAEDKARFVRGVERALLDGEAEHLSGFSGAAGGVVCLSCEAAAFPLSEEAHRFMVAAIGSPLAEAPRADEMALHQVERAVGETLEHHAHVQLRSAA